MTDVWIDRLDKGYVLEMFGHGKIYCKDIDELKENLGRVLE